MKDDKYVHTVCLFPVLFWVDAPDKNDYPGSGKVCS